MPRRVAWSLALCLLAPLPAWAQRVITDYGFDFEVAADRHDRDIVDRDADGFPDRWWPYVDVERGYYPALKPQQRSRLESDTDTQGSSGRHLFVPATGRNCGIETDVRDPNDENEWANTDVPPNVPIYLPRYIAVDPEFAWRLTGRARVEGLKRAQAYLAIALFDESKAFLREIRSPSARGTEGWEELSVPGLERLDPRARYVKLRLLVESDLAEHEGGCAFDDIHLQQTARVFLDLDRIIYPAHQRIRVEITSRGLKPDRYQGRLELRDLGEESLKPRLLDLNNQEVVADPMPLDLSRGEPLKRVLFLDSPGAGRYSLRFYYIERDLVGEDDERWNLGGSVSFGVLDAPEDAHPGLGVTADVYRHDEALLREWIDQLDVGWLRFPAFDPEVPSEGIAAANPELETLLHGLRRRGVDYIALLEPLPRALWERHAARPGSDRLASPFAGPSEVWQPFLDPLLNRLKDEVGYYHLAAGTGSLGGDPEGQRVVAERIHAAVNWAPLAVPEPEGALATRVPPAIQGRVTRIDAQTSGAGSLDTLVRRPDRSLRRELDIEMPFEDDPAGWGAVLRQVFRGRQAGVERLIFSPLVDRRRGLLRQDPLDPRRYHLTTYFLMVHQLAHRLRGLDRVRELLNPVDDRLHQGSSTWLLLTGSAPPLLVAWREGGDRTEPIYPGLGASLRDPSGRVKPLALEGGRWEAPLSPTPLLIENVDTRLLETLETIRFDDAPLESNLAPQRLRLLFANRFQRRMQIQGRLEFPEDWSRLSPPREPEFSATLEPGQQGQHLVPLKLPITETLGLRPVRLRIQFTTDRAYDLELVRHVPVVSNIALEIAPATGDSVLKITVTNRNDYDLDLVVYWLLPGQPPQEKVLRDVGAGQLRSFRVAYPAADAGREAIVGLRSGTAFINRRQILP